MGKNNWKKGQGMLFYDPHRGRIRQRTSGRYSAEAFTLAGSRHLTVGTMAEARAFIDRMVSTHGPAKVRPYTKRKLKDSSQSDDAFKDDPAPTPRLCDPIKTSRGVLERKDMARVLQCYGEGIAWGLMRRTQGGQNL